MSGEIDPLDSFEGRQNQQALKLSFDEVLARRGGGDLEGDIVRKQMEGLLAEDNVPAFEGDWFDHRSITAEEMSAGISIKQGIEKGAPLRQQLKQNVVQLSTRR